MTTTAYSSTKRSASLSSIILSLLCVLGLSLSAVALYEHVLYTRGLATGPSFCNLSSRVNCEAVNGSAWSVFFGLPVASYGLFFYTTLLGLLVVARRSRGTIASEISAVALLGGVVASLASLALFAISHFIIGALCLICIGLYLVNFVLLGYVWRRGYPGEFARGVLAGIRAIQGFVSSVFSPQGRAARLGLLGIVVVAVGSALSPELVYTVVARNRVASSEQPTREAVNRWTRQPVVSIQSDLGGGTAADYSIGAADAPIQIVEFADFECPGCRVLYARMHELLKEYEGKYRFVFRNYPLDQDCNPKITQEFHRYACLAASFTRCAGEQGRFWQALDFVFTDPVMTDERTTLDVRGFLLEQGSQTLALDSQAMEECLTSRRYHQKLQRDIEEANRVGLQSTPSIWVNGKQVERPTSETLRGIFNEILGSR